MTGHIVYFDHQYQFTHHIQKYPFPAQDEMYEIQGNVIVRPSV